MLSSHKELIERNIQQKQKQKQKQTILKKNVDRQFKPSILPILNTNSSAVPKPTTPPNETTFLNDIRIDIPTELNEDDIVITQTSNRVLECIALVCTSKEVDTNTFDRCIESIANTTYINKDIALYVIVNNTASYSILTEKLKRIEYLFKQVKIISLNIPKEEDIYIRNGLPLPAKLPPYGAISGPNYMFLKTMYICSKFNTTLLLESDCLVTPDWLQRLTNYTRNSGGFLIAGALYDGKTDSNYWNDVGISRHINGVALYATGDRSFQKFIKMFDAYLKKCIKEYPYAGYDHILSVMIQENLKKGTDFWRFVNRNYIHIQLIVNYSRPEDKPTTEDQIRKLYNYAILHKK
jgi:hypothetical protein